MGQCVLCEAETSIISQKKIWNGFICKGCFDKIPQSIKNNLTKYHSDNLKTILNYMDNLNKKIFFPTASFGSLHIDEIHGLFAIEENLKENFNPEDFTDMFYCLSLKEVGLNATNVSLDKSNNVICDFELHCWFEYPECSFTVPVKKKARCPSKRNGKDISYELPGDYFIFLNLFDQMLNTARKKYQEQNEPKFISKSSFNRFKAETLFMLGEGYNIDDVKKQYGILKHAFEGFPNYLSIIEQAYYILSDSLNHIQ